MRGGAVSCFGVVVTAADRAAATFAAFGERPPPPACGGHLPFQGRLCGKCAKRLPPQRELSAVRLTEDKPFCWGARCRNGGCIFHHSLREWSSSFCGRRQGMAAKPPQVTVSRLRTRGGGFPIAPATPSARLLCNLVVIQRWQVAAALSAAVTTTKPIGDAPMMPPLVLGAQAGEDILDMCAAPGGKTTQIAAPLILNGF